MVKLEGSMAGAPTKARLYDETFTVKEKDPDGKKFDKGVLTNMQHSLSD